MEEQIKIIEIPNFITIKIVKINEKHCAYYIESYSNKYFYADEDDFLKTHSKARILWALSIDMPMLVNNISIKLLEEDIYKLHKELHKKLTKGKLIRAGEGQKYYVITSDFRVATMIETNTTYDDSLYKLHNYFLSEIKAKEFASKMQEYLMELWKEELKK